MQINKLIVAVSVFSLLILSSSAMSEDKQAAKKDSKESVSAEKKPNVSRRSQGVNSPGNETILSPAEIEKRGRPTR